MLWFGRFGFMRDGNRITGITWTTQGQFYDLGSAMLFKTPHLGETTEERCWSTFYYWQNQKNSFFSKVTSSISRSLPPIFFLFPFWFSSSGQDRQGELQLCSEDVSSMQHLLYADHQDSPGGPIDWGCFILEVVRTLWAVLSPDPQQQWIIIKVVHANRNNPFTNYCAA